MPAILRAGSFNKNLVVTVRGLERIELNHILMYIES